MNFTGPLISIIIPCYNVEKYIENCITSVFRQTYSEWECIIINDGSRDKTLKILQQNKIFDDSRIQIFTQENKGLSYTRNFGIDVARGQFIYFLDADDLLPENSLADLIENVETNTDVISGITVTVSGENVERISQLQHPSEGTIVFPNDSGEVFIRTVSMGLSPVAQNRLYRRNFINKNNIRFQEKIYHEDELWFFETMFFARNVKYIDKVTYLYRTDNPFSITNSLNDSNLASYAEILEKIYRDYYVRISDPKKKAIVGRYVMYFKKIVLDFSIREKNKLSKEAIDRFLQVLKDTKLDQDSFRILNNTNEKYYRTIEKLSSYNFKIIEKYFFKNPVNSLRKWWRLFQIIFFLK